MNIFAKSISNNFRRVYAALLLYPASISSALILAIITIIRIRLDWSEQESYNFLFNCLQWSFAVGSIWGMTSTVYTRNHYNDSKSIKLSSIFTVVFILLTFISLYKFGIAPKPFNASRYDVLSTIAISRVSVSILVGFLIFIELSSQPKESSGISRALFMTQKAFFIATIYGLVILAGTTGVVSAIENLLYPDMSEKVYMYISTIVVFLSFTIFVGYFPDFKLGISDFRREQVQKQPQFIEILFGYILVPIFFALTCVLLLWSLKTFKTKTFPSFFQLSGISFTYAIGGIWLHIMVTHLDFTLAKAYKKIYPIAALIILSFEARALIMQLEKFGLKTAEYYFILLLFVTAITAILLSINKEKAHDTLIKLLCVVSIASVFPFIGYQYLPVVIQSQRLETILLNQGLLVDGFVVPAKNEPAQKVRESITDTVLYLAYSESTMLPQWFELQLSDPVEFKNKFGFEQAWPQIEPKSQPSHYRNIYLTLRPSILDTSEYEYMLTFDEAYLKINPSETLATEKGIYQFYWNISGPDNMPTIKVVLNDKTLIEQDMSSIIDILLAKYDVQMNPQSASSIEDMSLIIENTQIKLLLVFKNIQISNDGQQINYWFNINSIHFHEK